MGNSNFMKIIDSIYELLEDFGCIILGESTSILLDSYFLLLVILLKSSPPSASSITKYILELVSIVWSNCAIEGCLTFLRIRIYLDKFNWSLVSEMEFLLSILMDTFSCVVWWMASRTFPNVPVPIVFPIRYWPIVFPFFLF